MWRADDEYVRPRQDVLLRNEVAVGHKWIAGENTARPHFEQLLELERQGFPGVIAVGLEGHAEDADGSPLKVGPAAVHAVHHELRETFIDQHCGVAHEEL